MPSWKETATNMENSIILNIFSAIAIGGALGVLFVRSHVNAAMSMLLSVLGMSALLILMQAYLLGLLMVLVYGGAIMVLFVFIAMLVGDSNAKQTRFERIKLMFLWVLMMALIVYLSKSSPEFFSAPKSDGVLAKAETYGYLMFTKYVLFFEIAGAILLAAMVGVIVIAKEKFPLKKFKRNML